MCAKEFISNHLIILYVEFVFNKLRAKKNFSFALLFKCEFVLSFFLFLSFILPLPPFFVLLTRTWTLPHAHTRMHTHHFVVEKCFEYCGRKRQFKHRKKFYSLLFFFSRTWNDTQKKLVAFFPHSQFVIFLLFPLNVYFVIVYMMNGHSQIEKITKESNSNISDDVSLIMNTIISIVQESDSHVSQASNSIDKILWHSRKGT